MRGSLHCGGCAASGRDDAIAGRHGVGEFGEGVAGGVEVRIGEAELLEALEEPGGAGLLAERWRGDAEKLELPLAELRLVGRRWS